jgi:hypothetical protein
MKMRPTQVPIRLKDIASALIGAIAKGLCLLPNPIAAGAADVCVDDEKIGYIATQHPTERGYRRIAHICGPAISTANGRLNRDVRAFKNNAIPIRRNYVVEAQYHSESGGFGATNILLSANPRLTLFSQRATPLPSVRFRPFAGAAFLCRQTLA